MFSADRLDLVRSATAASGVGALLLTPGPDLRYVLGYDAHALERLTCLVVPGDGGDPFMMVPRLELPAAQTSAAGRLGVEFVPWDETDDPYAVVARILGEVGSVALADRMWAMQSLRFRAPCCRGRVGASPRPSCASCGCASRPPRRRRCAEAGGGHRRRSRAGALGRGCGPAAPSAEVGADIADADPGTAGHVTIDFVIVASSPNGASPAPRRLRPGDRSLVSRSWSTSAARWPPATAPTPPATTAVGEPPAADYARYLRGAAARRTPRCAAVRPGVTCRVGRRRRPRGDRGGRATASCFIHRTGHGIGLESHEEPYIVAGNDRGAGAGHGVLRGAGHLPAGRARRPHRRHRHLHRGRAFPASTTRPGIW